MREKLFNDGIIKGHKVKVSSSHLMVKCGQSNLSVEIVVDLGALAATN